MSLRPIQACLASLVVFMCAGCVEFQTDVPVERCVQGQPLKPLEPAVASRMAQCVAQAEAILAQSPADAFVALQGERLVMAWGDVHLPINTASVRKSVMRVLFGIAAERGLVDLDATLESIGVDDAKSPLLATERQATIRHLLQSRSGIYVEPLGEPPSWKMLRPERGEHQPGEAWFYNNWDFNALGTVFTVTTGLKLEQALDEFLAKPLGFESYCASHVTYQSGDQTEHAMYRFYMSAMDLARLGSLVLQDGQWMGRQLVSADWIAQSTRPVSQVRSLRPDSTYASYSYLWWIDDQGHVWAEGSGGQFIHIDRDADLVTVTRNNTGLSIPGRLWAPLGSPEDGITQAARDAHEALTRCLGGQP